MPMIIETSANQFFRVEETGDADLAHVWAGYEVKRFRGGWAPTARAARQGCKLSLVRKEGSRVVEHLGPRLGEAGPAMLASLFSTKR